MLAHSILNSLNNFYYNNTDTLSLWYSPLNYKYTHLSANNTWIEKYTNGKKINIDKSWQFANITLILVKLRLQKPNAYIEKKSQFDNLFKKKTKLILKFLLKTQKCSSSCTNKSWHFANISTKTKFLFRKKSTIL